MSEDDFHVSQNISFSYALRRIAAHARHRIMPGLESATVSKQNDISNVKG